MNNHMGKYLLMMYQHCKDFHQFFLKNQYNDIFDSLFHTLNQIMDIDNICSFFIVDHHNHFYSVKKNILFHDQLLNSQDIDSINESFYDHLSNHYHVCLIPIQYTNKKHGYLIFSKNREKVDFDNDEKELLKNIGSIYGDFLDNQMNYQSELFNQSFIEKVLNHIDANAYITNPYTDEILYINDKMIKDFHLKNPLGKKCWQVFQRNMGGRCPQCPIHQLIKDPQKCISWEEKSTHNQRIYQNYDSMIEWFDHSLVHFQYSLDITTFKKIESDAHYDDLTGIYNRRNGKYELSLLMNKAQKENKNIIICLYDLDHLKTINDLYGHQSGDEFIQMITQTVSSIIHHNNLFFRLSGDEFIIAFYDYQQYEVNQQMLKILKELEKIQVQDKIPYTLSFCFGLYEVLPQSQLSLNDVITHADEKMYSYKKKNHLRKALLDLKTHSPIAANFDYNKNLLYDALVKSTDDYIFVCNMKTGVFKYPPAMVDEFEFPSDVLTNAAAVFGAKIHPDDKYEFLNSNQQITDGRTDSHIVEYRALNKHNEYVWLRCCGHVEYDENNEPTLFAGFISNLGRKNYRDNLTGLYNQFEFEKRIQECHTPFTMMIINISHFKIINQLYNREFGDHVLRIISHSLQTILHKQAILYKLDGDEFGILYKETNHHEIQQIIHQIQNFADEKHIYEGHPFTIRFHGGITISPQDGTDYLELRRNCEIALQHSKHNTHSPFTFFNTHLLKEETYVLRLQNTLKQSMINHFEGFSLVYQPKVESVTHQLMGFEVLIRWYHSDFPQIGPGRFIPILEDMGGIVELGNWIFEQSLIKFKTFLNYQENLMISINVSYVQLFHEGFIDFVKKMISLHDVPIYQIILELTETSVVNDNQHAVDIINQLRSLGFLIAMDDFGKGSSSLSLLKDEPLDIIKIDQSFVRNIKNDSFNYGFTKFMINFCHQLHLLVVVEGVETEEELHIIDEFHPDYIQGYYISYPLSYEKTISYLKNH
ncbi:diguanylate cyclase domain-containing protein [Candidatus Stoquefichus massiliensis]|uniref:diguanylate cyclase domain-containing protein n=1 Tax=Candidatus Stoquefichus massiliensis TaxID=1470350 RepID=UPI0004B0634E|nr:EAL domain-containing protein [Candidatus Stoquefichus massiliensis]